MRFSYARQINLLNGQCRIEHPSGIECPRARCWAPSDVKQFPQAEKQLSADEVLVVDKDNGHVFAVSANEAQANGVAFGVVEVEPGEYVRMP